MLKHADLPPAVRRAISISLTLPVTTCTTERSFSTLRRVKTWLRSAMSDERLSVFCAISVLHESQRRGARFYQQVIDRFGRDVRRLHSLPQNDTEKSC